MKAFCLIADKMHPSIEPMLRQIGVEPVYQPLITPEQVHEEIHRYEGLIVRSKLRIDRILLEKASRLRFIGRAGAGLDQIDVEEVRKRNIELLNAPEGNRDAVAEHTVALILSLFNNLNKAH